jgi:Mg2+ and Co2+ transporter CorA
MVYLLIYLLIPQLKHMVKRLKMLPFYRSTLTEYVTRLSPYAVLTSYENIFLKDREEELTVRPHIRQLADEFHQAVSTNYLYLAEGTPSNKQIKVKLSSEGREYNDVLELIKEAFDQVYRDVKEISDQISARADAITNFLRDAATADSTRANLSLQESVKRLTVVTVLIAIITLVVGVLGVLPEEVRRRLFEVLLNILMECLERLF